MLEVAAEPHLSTPHPMHAASKLISNLGPPHFKEPCDHACDKGWSSHERLSARGQHMEDGGCAVPREAHGSWRREGIRVPSFLR